VGDLLSTTIKGKKFLAYLPSKLVKDFATGVSEHGLGPLKRATWSEVKQMLSFLHAHDYSQNPEFNKDWDITPGRKPYERLSDMLRRLAEALHFSPEEIATAFPDGNGSSIVALPAVPDSPSLASAFHDVADEKEEVMEKVPDSVRAKKNGKRPAIDDDETLAQLPPQKKFKADMSTSSADLP
jgi:hypothetical protein